MYLVFFLIVLVCWLWCPKCVVKCGKQEQCYSKWSESVAGHLSIYFSCVCMEGNNWTWFGAWVKCGVLLGTYLACIVVRESFCVANCIAGFVLRTPGRIVIAFCLPSAVLTYVECIWLIVLCCVLCSFDESCVDFVLIEFVELSVLCSLIFSAYWVNLSVFCCSYCVVFCVVLCSFDEYCIAFVLCILYIEYVLLNWLRGLSVYCGVWYWVHIESNQVSFRYNWVRVVLGVFCFIWH